MTTREEIRAALQHPNVQAFLRVIREGESSQSDDAYRMLYGGGFFSSFDEHPRQALHSPWGWTSAAGAYQIMAAVPGKVKTDTWDRIAEKYEFTDFSPATQDEAAVALIAERGALYDLLRGDLSEVLDKVSYEWASLPPGRYGQPTLDAKRVYATYEKWLPRATESPETGQSGPLAGDQPAVATPVPPTEKKMAAPFLMLAVNALANLLPSLIRLKSKSPTGELNAQVAEMVMPMIQNAVGATNEQDAVQRVMNDPAALQAADKAVRENYLELEEVGGGIKDARAFALDMTGTGPVWRQVGFGLMLGSLALGIVVGGGAVMAKVLLSAGTDAATSATILDYFKAMGFIVAGYVFGSSAGSKRKDDLPPRQW